MQIYALDVTTRQMLCFVFNSVKIERGYPNSGVDLGREFHTRYASPISKSISGMCAA